MVSAGGRFAGIVLVFGCLGCSGRVTRELAGHELDAGGPHWHDASSEQAEPKDEQSDAASVDIDPDAGELAGCRVRPLSACAEGSSCPILEAFDVECAEPVRDFSIGADSALALTLDHSIELFGSYPYLRDGLQADGVLRAYSQRGRLVQILPGRVRIHVRDLGWEVVDDVLLPAGAQVTDARVEDPYPRIAYTIPAGGKQGPLMLMARRQETELQPIFGGIALFAGEPTDRILYLEASDSGSKIVSRSLQGTSETWKAERVPRTLRGAAVSSKLWFETFTRTSDGRETRAIYTAESGSDPKPLVSFEKRALECPWSPPARPPDLCENERRVDTSSELPEGAWGVFEEKSGREILALLSGELTERCEWTSPCIESQTCNCAMQHTFVEEQLTLQLYVLPENSKPAFALPIGKGHNPKLLVSQFGSLSIAVRKDSDAPVQFYRIDSAKL